MTADKLIEVMARTMRDSEPGMRNRSHLYWVPSARAALAAIDAAGWAVVPKEPTKEIIEELGSYTHKGDIADAWRFALAAAPKVTE